MKKNVKLTTGMMLGFLSTIWLTGCGKSNVQDAVYQPPQQNQGTQQGQQNPQGPGNGGGQDQGAATSGNN